MGTKSDKSQQGYFPKTAHAQEQIKFEETSPCMELAVMCGVTKCDIRTVMGPTLPSYRLCGITRHMIRSYKPECFSEKLGL